MKGKKWLSLLLSGALVMGLVGCGGSGSGASGASGEKQGEDSVAQADSGSGETEGEEEVWDRPFDKYIQDEVPEDLGGYNFKIVDFNTDIWGPEEIKSEEDQLVVDIIEDVEKTFNCTIEVEDVSPDVLFENAQPAIMGGDKYADLLGTTMWAFGYLMGGQLVRDLSEVDSLDLSQDCFIKNLSDMATFGNATYGFGASFGSHLTNHWVIFYNSRIWNELNLPDPYELVRNNEWTWDKLLEYAKQSLRDNDGNGIVDSESDRWGMTAASGDLIRAMYLSMGGTYYAEDANGNMRLSCLDSESAAKMKFIYDYFQNDNVLYRNENVGYLEMFAAGKSLFMAYGNGTFDELKNMEDDFGVLPMPKWNSSQESYLNPIDHNAKIYSMTTTNKNTHEAGVIIMALARRYQAVDEMKIQEMYDTYWRFDEDLEMVENYVVGHGAYDVINIIKNANKNFEMPNTVLFDAAYNNTYSDITSTIAQYEEALNILLDEFFANFSK